MSTSNQVKVAHGLLLMSKFENMKERELICDFTIEVGNKSFRVHRAVLVASSDYFEGMFSSNMKEVREDCVEMKNLGVNAIERAIEFMYTGSAKIAMESVQDILHVAELFQLDGLKNLCFQFLLDNLSPKNCLSVINLAQTYNRQDVKEEAERIVLTNFETVISSEMFPFISRSDLLRYISNVGHETSWKATISWAKDKEEFSQLIEGIDIKNFPFKFLFETVLQEQLVRQSESAKKFAISVLFSDAENLHKNLDIDNCISLNNLPKPHSVNTDVIDGVITNFMKKNFEIIASKPEFCDIGKNDVLELFRSSETRYSSERIKWGAALKWTKHDSQNRRKAFPELFSLLRLDNFSFGFITETIRTENLVTESRRCSDLLMDAILSKGRKLESENSTTEDDGKEIPRAADANEPWQLMQGDGSASVQPHESDSGKSTDSQNFITQQQPCEGKMSYLISPVSLPGWTGQTTEITYSFPAGELEGISFPTQEFKAYLPYGLGLRSRLEQAFNEGQVFKLEHHPNQRQGRIVWADIPHKTNKSGGPMKNGYPDLGYINRLMEVLNSKGF